jgi:feruloyl esterase
MRLLLLFAALAATLVAQGGGSVQFRDWAQPPSSAKPGIACPQLLSLTGYDLSLISAELTPATAQAPEHCRVLLMAQPEINIEVNLPTSWNGRFYMFGNGGWAGESFDTPGRVANHARALRGGFATASTDTGHSAALEPGASFALQRQKLLDYGFRSLHVTAEAASCWYAPTTAPILPNPITTGARKADAKASLLPNDSPMTSMASLPAPRHCLTPAI